MAGQTNESGRQIFVSPANQIWAKNKLKKELYNKKTDSIVPSRLSYIETFHKYSYSITGPTYLQLRVNWTSPFN